jgi:hypothetical protein
VAKIKGKKGNTPENFDEFLRIRETISDEEYTDYWRGVNALKREYHENERGPEYSPEFAEAWSVYNDEWLLKHFRGEEIETEEPEIEEVPEVVPEPEPEPEPKPKRRYERRIVRASKGWASRDAKRIGGHVVRVDRNGKRNRRGRHWKAIK